MGLDPVTASIAGPAIGGLMGGAGNVMGAQASAKAEEEKAKLGLQGTREQLDEQRNEFKTTSEFEKANQAARQKAYDEAITRGSGQMGSGESELMSSLGTANPEIAQQEADLRYGNAKAIQDTTGQIHANLAAQGVRGGQAATLEGRAVGDMGINAQKDINQLKYQDADTRAAQMRAYLAAKAQRGQAATLSAGAI